ncbi:MAG: peroxiredoxin [Deltaproteobacteria bacterium]|jgi:peroxiredoxin Q/BCP|nr:peroxiredoxin [Deltaproteobacteria bacterium]
MSTAITLTPGAPAPAWRGAALTPQGPAALSGEALRGAPYVLYFYPKDDTPGCTAQACDFRDSWAAWRARGYRVVGVSPDSLESHESFRARHDLPHDLVSDPSREVCEAWGVWREKQNYGKTYLGLARSTFVVSAEGVVLHAQYNVKATGHVARLLKLLGAEGGR